MLQRTILFRRDKDTKNTVRFQEVVEDDSAPLIGTLYVQKHVEPPSEIFVTISDEPVFDEDGELVYVGEEASDEEG